MYKVSLIIPVYNVEKYIGESFQSALNQSFESIEYIVVDDCSNDNSMSIITEILQNHTRSKDVCLYKHLKNEGLSAARNTGLKYANGDFVFFMDSDDEITPNCIEKHYCILNASDADFTIANIRLEGAKSIHIKSIQNEVVRMPLMVSYMKRMWSTSACNKLYRRTFLVKNGLSFREGLLHEDILWSYKVVSKAKEAIWVNDFTYIYKIRANSITTHKNNSRKLESLLFILRTIHADWEHGNIPLEYKKDYLNFINFWRLNTALLLLNYDGSYKECDTYYSQIVEVVKESDRNLYSYILKLPYYAFWLLVKPAYLLYKRV